MQNFLPIFTAQLNYHFKGCLPASPYFVDLAHHVAPGDAE
jgi:hypothetical protein